MEKIGYISENTINELKRNTIGKILTIHLESSTSVFTDGSGYFYNHNIPIKIIIPELPEGDK
jgi:hypothetical protein